MIQVWEFIEFVTTRRWKGVRDGMEGQQLVAFSSAYGA